MDYAAQSKDGMTQIYLTRDSQMDKHLENGFNIIAETDDGKEILIATPEKGFLVERPVFPVVHSVTFK